MTQRADLLRAITAARTGQEVSDAVAALDAFDRRVVQAAAQDRELDLAAGTVAARLTPVPLHEHHTAATDWLAELDTDGGDWRTAMVAEASRWVQGLDPGVLADGEEFAEQARGRARTLASAHGAMAKAAAVAFFDAALYFTQRTGASGLPQIDQLVDPNNQPSPTPYPTETFDNFAPEQNDYNGGIEDPAHGSQISSENAPLLQQVRQQDGSGSGFGSGPERPDQHSTSMDTSNSYAEVPLGPPGQIPTAPGAAPAAASSAPSPGATMDAVADDDRLQQQMKQGSYTPPDAAGFRWVARASEVMQPFHAACSTNHWPDEGCGLEAHTASVAVGYAMNLEDAHRLARCELLGAREGLRAIQKAASARALAEHHNRLTAAWADSDRSAEDTAVLHGFQAVVRPVLATGDRGAAGDLGGRLDFSDRPGRHSRAASWGQGSGDGGDPDDSDRCPHCRHSGDCGCSCCAAGIKSEGASSLPQIQQITDPNNIPTPQADDLPDGVMFPLGDAFATQWETGPDGARPKGKTAAKRRSQTPSRRALQLFGNMDALDGRNPHHKDAYPFGKNAHGTYLRAWNSTRGAVDAFGGRDPISADDYSGMTGRPDLYRHYMDAYNGRRNMPAGTSGGTSYEVLSSRRTADTLTMPHQTTDDFAAPYNSPATTPDPASSTLDPKDRDFNAGLSDGREDARNGVRPTFADNSSRVSPYVSGYAQGYASQAQFPATQPDVPGSMGGDSGQARNAQEAERAFQVARASRRTARDFSQAERDADTKKGDALHGKLPIEDAEDLRNAERLRGKVKGIPKGEVDAYMERKEHEFGKAGLRVSAAFVPDRALRKADFVKGYRYAVRWRPGARLVSQGSAAFEAGVYAGITDNPGAQRGWVAAHRKMAGREPVLGQRMDAHRAFTLKFASRKDDARVSGLYLTAATTVDLVTEGPGTSPDPMGSTPLNGPGTPPPMGGKADPAQPGGSPPYQGAPPMPGGPVVPDDVMGKPQQKATPDGPPAMGFSGPGKGYTNQNLAPRGPNAANAPGYSNPDAYQGDPYGGDKVAAFRQRVQSSLQRMREQAS